MLGHPVKVNVLGVLKLECVRRAKTCNLGYIIVSMI